ncbi:MAG: class I SAM-dependent methyltransferase [Methanobacterium sp.]|jgi:2-polyprenyl-3-methyl-5-hydroxy-6-metoxy-1,4-benzoquinol methylase
MQNKYADHRLKLIMNEINSYDNVLDIGCVEHDLEMTKKNLWLHQHIVNKAAYVLGIDILESEIKILNEYGYNVAVADAENFLFKKNFDVIVAGELIEHLSNPGAFLDCCRKNLKENGKLILTTPNVWYYQFYTSMLLKSKINSLNIEHTCWYDKKTISQLLERHGFKAIKIEFVIPNKYQRGYHISKVIYNLNLKYLGGESIFIVAKMDDLLPKK